MPDTMVVCGSNQSRIGILMYYSFMHIPAQPRDVLKNMTISMDDIRYKMSEKQLEMRLRTQDILV